ncbi:unnamed protein product, partial [Ectocarpus sp. 12 AP-2014]
MRRDSALPTISEETDRVHLQPVRAFRPKQGSSTKRGESDTGVGVSQNGALAATALAAAVASATAAAAAVGGVRPPPSGQVRHLCSGKGELRLLYVE